ncbi:MAG: hypothetical protein ACLGXA_17980 [Acidobacteriota bacterium]
MKPRIFSVLIVFAALLAPSAHAQWPVFDSTNYANAIKEYRELQSMYTTAVQTRDQVIAAYNLAYQMSKMPQNLAARYKSEWTQWNNYSAPNTYGNTSAWINALDLGSAANAQRAYGTAVIQVQNYPASTMSSQDAATQTTIQNQYATSEIGQGTLTSALSVLGTIRSNAQAFSQKLANLESDTYSTDPNLQTSNALLGKVNSAALLQVHSQQDTNQLLSAMAAQQSLDAKSRLDTLNRLINQAVYFDQNFDDTMQKTTGGITQAIQSISLSPGAR